MTEPTKRQLVITNMKQAKIIAEQDKRIREIDAQLTATKRKVDALRHAAQNLAKLASNP